MRPLRKFRHACVETPGSKLLDIPIVLSPIFLIGPIILTMPALLEINMTHEHGAEKAGTANAFLGRKPWMAALIMLAFINAFFLFREHWSHIVGYWPYLLLLACPLMHLFHGPGSHEGDSSKK